MYNTCTCTCTVCVSLGLYLTYLFSSAIDGNINAVSAWPGESIELGCLGDSPQWWFNGSVLTDADIGISIGSFPSYNALSIDPFTESLAGVYTCNDSNGNASVVVSVQGS